MIARLRKEKTKFIAVFIFLLLLTLGIGLLIIPRENPSFLSVGILAIFLSFFFLVALQMVMWLVVEIGLPKPANVTPIPKRELLEGLLSLNNPNRPFQVKQEGDLITVSWKLAEANWYEFFAKARVKADYKLRLKLIEKDHLVRAIEHTSQIDARLGLPHSSMGRKFSRGWHPILKKKEVAYGIKDIFPLEIGKLYQINLDAQSFREPFLKEITESGWTIQPCILSLKLGI